MEIEHKSYKARVESIGDEGEIIALVSCFNNVDRAKEVVRPGAFASITATQVAQRCLGTRLDTSDRQDSRSTRDATRAGRQGKFNLKTQAGYEAHQTYVRNDQ